MSLLPKTIHPSWINFINNNKIKKELEKIETLIGNNYFPNKENILRFLSQDLNNLKCIIVGMEPYPTSYYEDGKEIPMATGRSFEVSILKGKDWNYKIKQSSLRNILIFFRFLDIATTINNKTIGTVIIETTNKYIFLNPPSPA